VSLVSTCVWEVSLVSKHILLRHDYTTAESKFHAKCMTAMLHTLTVREGRGTAAQTQHTHTNHTHLNVGLGGSFQRELLGIYPVYLDGYFSSFIILQYHSSRKCYTPFTHCSITHPTCPPVSHTPYPLHALQYHTPITHYMPSHPLPTAGPPVSHTLYPPVSHTFTHTCPPFTHCRPFSITYLFTHYTLQYHTPLPTHALQYHTPFTHCRPSSITHPLPTAGPPVSHTVWREISVGIYFRGFRGSEKI
jgi:hypothetical protein